MPPKFRASVFRASRPGKNGKLRQISEDFGRMTQKDRQNFPPKKFARIFGQKCNFCPPPTSQMSPTPMGERVSE
jgi:hypothetical protein